MASAQPRLNPEKFKELLVYVAKRADGDPCFGATRLNKTMFYADFLAYLRLGKPITGAAYQRLPQGPAARAMLPVMKEMVGSGEVTIEARGRYGFTQKRVYAKRDPNVSVFSAEERQLIDEVIAAFEEVTARDASDMWQLAKNGETIPYCVALVGSAQPTEPVAQIAREIRQRLLERADAA